MYSSINNFVCMDNVEKYNDSMSPIKFSSVEFWQMYHKYCSQQLSSRKTSIAPKKQVSYRSLKYEV